MATIIKASLTAVLISLLSSVTNADSLILTNGDTIVCSKLFEKISKNGRYFSCGTKKFPAYKVIGVINRHGTYQYRNNIYFRKLVDGKISLCEYSKIVIDSFFLDDDENIPYLYDTQRSKRKKWCYSFDNSKVIDFKHIGSNESLTRKVMNVPDAYSTYNAYRFFKVVSLIGLFSAGPIIMSTIPAHKKPGPFIAAGCSTAAVSTCLLFGSRKMLKTSLRKYNHAHRHTIKLLIDK